MTNILQAAPKIEAGLKYVRNTCVGNGWSVEPIDEAITALRQAIAQAEQQESVGYVYYKDVCGLQIKSVALTKDISEGTELYTAPPQREWVEPSDEQIMAATCYVDMNHDDLRDFRAVLKLAKDLNNR